MEDRRHSRDQAVHEGTRFALSDYNLHGATLENPVGHSAAEGPF